MDIEQVPYDGSYGAEIVGTSGLFEGERTFVRLGESVVVGRSRTCHLSVARSAECMRMSRESLDQHPSYRKVSRRHLKITLLGPDLIEVEDLSTNGTVVDGFKVDRRVIPEFRQRPDVVKICFGEGEVLEVRPCDDVKPDEGMVTSNSSIHRNEHADD